MAKRLSKVLMLGYWPSTLRPSGLLVLLLSVIGPAAVHAGSLTVGSSDGRSGNSVTVSDPDTVLFGNRLWAAATSLADPAAQPGSPEPVSTYTFNVRAKPGAGWEVIPFTTPVNCDFSGATGDAIITRVQFRKIKDSIEGGGYTYDGYDTIDVKAFVPRIVIHDIIRGIPGKPEPMLPPSVGLRQSTQAIISYTPLLGSNPIRFVVSNSGDEAAGEVTLTPPSPSDSISRLTIRGNVGSSLYHGHKLILVAKIGPRIAALSQAFSVCAHPIGINFGAGQPFSAQHVPEGFAWGVQYPFSVLSSSGSAAELINCKLLEIVDNLVNDNNYGSSEEQVDFATIDEGGNIRDTNAIGADSVVSLKAALDEYGNHGIEINNQHFIYSCAICAISANRVSSPSIPNSGFGINYADRKVTGRYYLDVSHPGKQVGDVDAGVSATPRVFTIEIQ